MDNYHYNMDRKIFNSLKPMSKHVIILLKDDRKEHKGIALAKMTPVVPDRGLVVKVADDIAEKLITVGSKVLFERYMGRKIFVESDVYLILQEEHIHCILPDDFDIGIKYDCILK